MAQLLAPYHNGMRLGQGFNSYTQQICLDNAVLLDNKANRDRVRAYYIDDKEKKLTNKEFLPDLADKPDPSAESHSLISGECKSTFCDEESADRNQKARSRTAVLGERLRSCYTSALLEITTHRKRILLRNLQPTITISDPNSNHGSNLRS